MPFEMSQRDASMTHTSWHRCHGDAFVNVMTCCDVGLSQIVRRCGAWLRPLHTAVRNCARTSAIAPGMHVISSYGGDGTTLSDSALYFSMLDFFEGLSLHR